MSLFDGFRRKKVDANDSNVESRTMTSSPATGENSSIVEEETEEYYFENPIELAIYGKKFAKCKKIIWLSGNNYLNEYQKGYQLFEQRQFKQAIEVYKNCLRLNPIGISARFEMCEAYLQLHDLSLAKQTLLDMKEFLIEEKNIARFYRRFGFAEIEQGNYREAAACYQYSLKFENHSSVSQELMYIKSKVGFGVAFKSPEKVLANAQIPILTATTLS